MKNPLLERYGRQNTGSLAEKKAAKRLGGSSTLASGALDFDKGDYELGDLLVDSKSTVNKSISLKRDWLDKISKEAHGKQLIGAVHLQFTDQRGEPVKNGSWFVIPEGLMRSLLK